MGADSRAALFLLAAGVRLLAESNSWWEVVLRVPPPLVAPWRSSLRGTPRRSRPQKCRSRPPPQNQRSVRPTEAEGVGQSIFQPRSPRLLHQRKTAQGIRGFQTGGRRQPLLA